MSQGLEGLIFDVQRFSVHDGPGIRTTVFFKGCALRCPWCQNPESLRPRIEIAFRADRCREGGDCLRVCPVGALAPGGARVDRTRCDGCGLCVPACPFGALEGVGRRVSVEGLAGELLRDAPFYRTSGGGVTFSGGEATLQLPFVVALAGRLKEAGVGVGIQTSGTFRWEAFEPHLPLFDFLQFDLKVMDPREHRSLLGSDNGVILSNAGKLVEAGAPVSFRMPVVPGGTDSEGNLRAVARFLRGAGAPRLRLLAYHPMGESKLPRLGFPIPAWSGERARGGERGGDAIERASSILRSEGIEVAA